MSHDDKKIDIPLNIQEELQEFKTYNTDYNKTKLPLNKIDKNPLLFEWISIHEYIRFKLANQRELELNESEIDYLKEIADSLKNMWKEEWKRKITQERNEQLKFVNDSVNRSEKDDTITKDFAFWFSIYLKDSIRKIEHIFEEIKKQNAEISLKDFSKIPSENKTDLFEIINKNNNLISEQIASSYSGTSHAIVFVCRSITSMRKKYGNSEKQLLKIFQNLILNVDQLFFYTFGLLNCTKLLIHYSNYVYETMIFSDSKDSHTLLSPKKVYYDSILMYALITELYLELFPKFQSVYISTTNLLNELPDQIEIPKDKQRQRGSNNWW